MSSPLDTFSSVCMRLGRLAGSNLNSIMQLSNAVEPGYKELLQGLYHFLDIRLNIVDMNMESAPDRYWAAMLCYRIALHQMKCLLCKLNSDVGRPSVRENQTLLYVEL